MAVSGSGGRQHLPRVSPATLDGAVQFDMRSAGNGRVYRIYVHEPMHEPPPSGYPVVYVTDGNAFFATAALQAEAAGEGTMVVGIGYPASDRRDPDILRYRDLTWEAPPAEIGAEFTACLGSQDISYGGADGFLDFIMEELEPVVGALYAIDRKNTTLFGDSLGGLFALYVLFKHPGKFRTFVAGSPAIWWNDKALLRGVSEFRALVESGAAAPRVLITVGSLEQTTESVRTPRGMSPEQFRKMIQRTRMVDNARELARELESIRGSEGYLMRYQMLEGETHQSVVAATISRAIGFSLRDLR